MASAEFQIFKPRKNTMLHIFYEQKSEKKKMKKNKHGLTKQKFILREHNRKWTRFYWFLDLLSNLYNLKENEKPVAKARHLFNSGVDRGARKDRTPFCRSIWKTGQKQFSSSNLFKIYYKTVVVIINLHTKRCILWKSNPKILSKNFHFLPLKNIYQRHGIFGQNLPTQALLIRELSQ